MLDEADEQTRLLIRLRGNRKLYGAPQAKPQGQRGRKPTHGSKLQLNRAATLGVPDHHLRVEQGDGGWVVISVWQEVHVYSRPNVPLCAVRVEVFKANLRPILRACFKRLRRAGVVGKYHYLKKQVIVSIDGVEHFSSTKVHCQSCTTHKHRNGELSYHHAGLAAVLVHPEQKEVFPLDFEPLLKPHGARKNDCERHAAKRLCAALAENYPDLEIILVEDAL